MIIKIELDFGGLAILKVAKKLHCLIRSIKISALLLRPRDVEAGARGQGLGYQKKCKIMFRL